jgi:hypothetical protein
MYDSLWFKHVKHEQLTSKGSRLAENCGTLVVYWLFFLRIARP